MNRSLRKFVEWDVYADSFGLMAASRQLYGVPMSKPTDKEARELGRESNSGGVEFVTFFFKKFNLENV